MSVASSPREVGVVRQELSKLLDDVECDREAEAALANTNTECLQIEAPERRRGGKRKGAGRKKSGVRRGGSHRRRPELSSAHPVHVTLRMDRRRPDLRNHHIYNRVKRVLRAFLGRDDFRVVHISIQANHLHMLVEADDRHALSRNMKSFAIRMQHALRERYGCKLFSHRYHAVQIKTARQARRALAYVLNNWRRHRLDWDDRGRLLPAKLDEFSSALAFKGWRGYAFVAPVGYEVMPVSAPRTWLLAAGWRDVGLIDPFETPGPLD
jgi:REP element-mobilizing transposase RayT